MGPTNSPQCPLLVSLAWLTLSPVSMMITVDCPLSKTSSLPPQLQVSHIDTMETTTGSLSFRRTAIILVIWGQLPLFHKWTLPSDPMWGNCCLEKEKALGYLYCPSSLMPHEHHGKSHH